MAEPFAENIAKDFFDELSQVTGSVRQRYTTLRRVLIMALDGQLKGLSQVFPNLSSKMSYLIREHHLRRTEEGKQLAQAINAARHRMRTREETTDEELLRTWPFDCKAVVLFIAHIYKVDVPHHFSSIFPTGWLTERQQPLAKDLSGKMVERLRCTVDSWDDKHIFVTLANDGRQMAVDCTTENKFCAGDWSYIRALLREGSQLNLIRPREKDHTLQPELIIFNPDSLISVTAVAGCFNACGTSPYWEIVRKIKPKPLTKYILLGNLAGQFLDEAAYEHETTYTESVRRFFRKNALDIAACEGLDNSFHAEAQKQQTIIRNMMNSTLHLKSKEGFRSGNMILEPSFFCEALGLQGRMDFIHQDMSTIVEQKSGKGAWGSTDETPLQQTPHYVQLLLYRAIFHYSYGHKNYDEMSAMLFYSKYAKGLLELGSAPKLLFEAIKMRNQLAWLELHCAEQGFSFLEKLTPETICPAANGTLWKRYTRPELSALLEPLQRATPLERAYVLRFEQFVANEHVLSKFGNFTKEDAGFAMLWNCSTEEKRQAGNLYERFNMEPMEDNPEQSVVTFEFTTAVDADTTNFRLGDIVIFYPTPRGEEPQATNAIAFRATLIRIQPESVTVKLRNPQNTKVFEYYKDCLWTIEHDFMEASFDAQYRGIYSLLSATQQRRDLILGQRKPRVRPLLETESNDYEFKQLVRHVAAAQDLYLIIGPPGTGKTSFGMLNVLKEQLTHEGTNVLLMAYTNRAVDEMCSKLVKEGIDFVRLGSETNCSKECVEHLLDARLAIYNKVDDIRECIRQTHVFCGTTTAFNSHSQLFLLKQFDLAIVDEASQLLEPDLIGLFSAKHGEEDAIRKFVLIGDEKQLPAVVQQEPAVSAVSDEQLHAIGLTNCRLSFFERMLKLHADMGEEFCHLLTRQGRMHVDIQAFPSLAFYNNALQPVPLPHQKEIMSARPVLFINHDDDNPNDESDKVNRREAEIIARVVSKAIAGGKMQLQDIGIIVPYRNQISTVRSLLTDALQQNEDCSPTDISDLTIDTVERYQGSERDMIVYGFTAKRPYQLEFLTNNDYVDDQGNTIDRKLNVALTRARKRLVLVGNASLLCRDKVFRELIDYCKAQSCYREATEI